MDNQLDDAADHAHVSVTSAKKRSASDNSSPNTKNKKMHYSADDVVLPHVTKSVPTKKTLADDQPVTQPTVAQETQNVAHYSADNIHGDKTPDIDELIASNNVLAPENGISLNTTQPLNYILQNSVEPRENGATIHAADTDTEVAHVSDIEPNVTNDLLDAMVANVLDSDPPHDMDEDFDHVDINGFEVNQEFKDIAREIFDKHGDIFAKASVSGLLRHLLFNIVCTISDKLARFTITELSLGQLKSMYQNVEELLKVDVDVTWLAESLKELIEMKEMVPQLRHLLLVSKQKKKIVVELEKERELQLKIVQKANQKAEDIDIRVKTLTEEIDSIYHTLMTKVTKMQQCKDKPAKDVASF